MSDAGFHRASVLLRGWITAPVRSGIYVQLAQAKVAQVAWADDAQGYQQQWHLKNDVGEADDGRLPGLLRASQLAPLLDGKWQACCVASRGNLMMRDPRNIHFQQPSLFSFL